MRPINYNKEFGFNILTEHKKSKDNDNEDSYEMGESIKQYSEPYTDDAIILQSILEYSIGFGEEDYFKSREISENHLIEKCDYYIRMYEGNKDKTKTKARAERINYKVVASLEKLEYLDLVDSEPSEAENHQPTQKYRFTKFGRMIGLLLFYCNSNTIDLNTYKAIFNQIRSFYNTLNHAYALFCLIFFKRCHIEGKFLYVIYSLVLLLKNASDNKYEFLNQIRFLNIFYRDLDFWNIYKNSLDELSRLDISKYRMVLYNLKLDIEEIHESKFRHLKEFERLRLEKIRHIYDVVVGGYCNTCKNFFISTMKTTHYLESYITSVISEKYVFDIKCPSCSNDYLDFQSII
jgi:hypothetical protein